MENIDKSLKGFYTGTGIAWILAAMLSAISTIMDFSIPQNLPADPAVKMKIVAEYSGIIQLRTGLQLTAYILTIFALFGLYLSLRNGGIKWILPGTALFILGIILELVVRLAALAVFPMAELYMHTPDAALQSGYVAVTDYIIKFESIVLLLVLTIDTLAALATGMALRSGIYNKITSWLFLGTGGAWAIGCLGLFTSRPSLIIFIFPGSLFLIIAMIMIGLRLIAIDREIA